MWVTASDDWDRVLRPRHRLCAVQGRSHVSQAPAAPFHRLFGSCSGIAAVRRYRRAGVCCSTLTDSRTWMKKSSGNQIWTVKALTLSLAE